MGLKESGLRGSIRNVSTGIGAAITIDTLEATNVGEDSATIRGEITELTNFGEDAEVFFEWGEITEGLPNTTDIQMQDTVGVFTEDLTNLSEDTTHEFQAFGSVRDVSDEGVVLTFETVVVIPDSVVFQVRREEFADPWPFNVGDAEMAYSGLSTTNGLVDNDGSGRGSADGPQNLPENETFGIAITAGFDSVTSTVYLTGSKDSNADCFVRSGAGEITARFADNNGNTLQVGTDSEFDDGTVRPIVINKRGNSASDIDIFVGDMETPKATTTAENDAFDHDNYSNSVEQGFWDLFFDGSFNDQQIDAMVGCFEFNSEPYEQSDRGSFVERRSEV